MFNKAMDQADKELDIVKYIRLQKLTRSLHEHLFTDIERYLLRNQQCFVINSDNSKSNRSCDCEPEVFNDNWSENAS